MTKPDVPAWVAERAEIERTGQRVRVAAHDDNTGMNCRNVGPATLVEDMRNHDCCYLCNDAVEHAPTCPAFGRVDFDKRTVWAECTCPAGAL